jgi:hypothetical protein
MNTLASYPVLNPTTPNQIFLERSSHVNATQKEDTKLASGADVPPDADFLLPPIQFSRCELRVLLSALQRCGDDSSMSREDRSNAKLLHHATRTHFERVLCMNKEELFFMLGLPADRPPLAFPENVARQDIIDSLRKIYRFALEAEQAKVPGLVGWPTMEAVLDHIEEHGLPPKEAL